MKRLLRGTLTCLLSLPLLLGALSGTVFAGTTGLGADGLVVIEDEPIPAAEYALRYEDDVLQGTGDVLISEEASLPGSAPSIGSLSGVPATSSEFRGLWVASVVNIDWPKVPTVDAAALKAEALATLDFAKAHRFNAIFLQIRPTADSLFPSAIFPWSQYLTGKQGLAPSDGFDPLAFWIAEAHARGIELHAWLNPYRITKKKAADPATDVTQLAPTHPARLHPEWVVKHSDGNLYFNPGLPEVRSLLLDSVSEILTKYEVDGIHFDDYFYPDGSANKNTAKATAISNGMNLRGMMTDAGGKTAYISPFDDSAAFSQYGGAFAKLDDWRRSNVDSFVRDVSVLIRNHSPAVRFGISPFGIWRNKANDLLGSDTNGSESYSLHAADTRKWVKEGILDYIAPQIYWNTGFKIADYNKLSAWWSDVVKGTGVDLYIGQAAYRMDADEPTSAWYGVSELERQMKANQSNPEVDGSIFFSYQSFVERPAVAAALKALREAADGLSTPVGGGLAVIAGSGSGTGTPSVPLLLGRPAQDMKTGYSGIYLNGASNPAKPLLLNGIPVLNRSPSGYFGLFMPLSSGKNTFVLSQEGVYTARTIWRNKPIPGSGTSTPAKMKTVEIPASSVFPQHALYGETGDSYTFSCTAPIGAKVSVKIGGTSYPMTPATTRKPGAGAYPTTWRYTWKMPAQTGTARVVNLGAPVYSMTYEKKTKTRTAPGKIGIILPGAPFYAEMRGDPTETYKEMSTSGGTQFYLEKGSKEAITGMYGTWVRLASGLYVKDTAVKTAIARTAIRPVVGNPTYETGVNADSFSFTLAGPNAVTVDFDGSALRVRVPHATSLPLPSLPGDGLFESVLTEKYGSGLQYVFTLGSGAQLDGYALDKTADGYEVPLKRHILSVSVTQPLLGKTILLDPGHGGLPASQANGDTGAIGPAGLFWTERNINLSNAQILKKELERLGATVQMTRETDVPVSLEERVAISRKLRPDLFIAIHADSMEDNVDISKLSGFSVWYREPLAEKLGAEVLQNVVDAMGKKNRKLNQRNFYVVRGTWCPSILYEAGFVPNPTEFEALTNPSEQSKMAAEVAAAIVEWYRE